MARPPRRHPWRILALIVIAPIGFYGMQALLGHPNRVRTASATVSASRRSRSTDTRGHTGSSLPIAA